MKKETYKFFKEFSSSILDKANPENDSDRRIKIELEKLRCLLHIADTLTEFRLNGIEVYGGETNE